MSSIASEKSVEVEKVEENVDLDLPVTSLKPFCTWIDGRPKVFAHVFFQQQSPSEFVGRLLDEENDRLLFDHYCYSGGKMENFLWFYLWKSFLPNDLSQSPCWHFDSLTTQCGRPYI